MRPAVRPPRQHHRRRAEAVDITERRRGEEALRQSQKMEAIGQLTGGVAHDFNNLLTIIRSATDFLRRRELPEERRRRYVDAISETVERASNLTAQLLAFARRQPLKPQIFNVGSQVESVARTGPAAGRRPHRDRRRDRRFRLFYHGRHRSVRDRADQPRHQRPRRHGGRRPPHHLRSGRFRAFRACARNRRAAAITSRSRSPTPAAASRRKTSTRSSSRSSPPRRSARAPASASARPSASQSSPRATSR